MSRVGLALALAFVALPLAGAPAATRAAEPGIVRLMAVGDMELAFGVGRRIVRDGPQVLFAGVADYFAEADLVVGNLECSLSRNGVPWPRKLLHFGAPRAAAEALAAGGMDAVSVANNHSLDFGRQAFLDTLGLLETQGVGHAGGGTDRTAAHEPLILERNGLRLALLSYVTGFWGPVHFNTRAWEAGPKGAGVAIARVDDIAADVTAARALADVVIVSVHSDGELRRMPKRSQRRMADAAITAGAALVIGHGPHVLQGYRSGDHTLIAYSLGNFVFPGYGGESLDSAILDVTLSTQGVESFTWIPIVLAKALPRPARGAEIDRVMARLRPI